MRRALGTALFVSGVGCLAGAALACSCLAPNEAAQRKLVASVGAIYQLTIDQASDRKSGTPPGAWVYPQATVRGVWKGPVMPNIKFRLRAPEAAQDPCGFELKAGYRGTWAFSDKDADDAWLPVSGCNGFLWEQIDKGGRLPIFLGREAPQSVAPR
jgi:hypothetical protein